MLSVIRGGVETSIDDGVICRLVGQEGWGMAPAHRIGQRGPLQHGETDHGYRLDPRIGRLVLMINGSSYDDVYTKRSQLLSLFAPSDTPISLKWDRNGGRQIDVHFVGDLLYSGADRAGYTQNAIVTLQAPDPTFYKPGGSGVTFSLAGGSDSWTIPHAVPVKVGASAADFNEVVAYPGNWRSYPHLIRITGPITNPVITNVTTGDKLDFTGITISGGSYYDIDLRYGYKTVVNQAGTNKIADLTEDSDLATFHLAAAPEPGSQFDPRNNSITVTGTGITASTKVDISYRERYLGL